MDRTSSSLDGSTTAQPHLMDVLQLRAHSLWTNTRTLVRDQTLLALLEVQRAGMGFVKIVAAAVIISVLAVSAWMALITALVIWAVGAGLNVGIAIVVAAVLNIVAAVALIFWIKAQIPELMFAATVRQLKGEPPPEDEAAHAQ